MKDIKPLGSFHTTHIMRDRGSIVLFHNAGEHTPEALPDILDYLLAEGYKIVPISKILLTCDYTIDHEGRQCPAVQ